MVSLLKVIGSGDSGGSGRSIFLMQYQKRINILISPPNAKDYIDINAVYKYNATVL